LQIGSGPGTLSERLEEFLHSRKEARRLRRILLRGNLLEFFQKLTLAAAQILRRLHGELNEQVSRPGLAQYRHALAFQPELSAILRPLRNLHPRLRSVQRCHLDGSAKCSSRHRDGHLAVEIGPIALEEFMRSR